MKIISENEVDEAALNDTKSIDRIDGFKAGANWCKKYYEELAKDLIVENQGLKLYKDNEARRFEELAVEFAKYLFSTEITKHTSMENSVKYIPSEFNLMKGNLIKNGEELFKLFLKERNNEV